MREILFRGKRVCDNEWIYGDLVQYLGFGKVRIIPNYTGAGAEDVIPETAGQYTGLTDKNGTKIFEGDIIQKIYHLRGVIQHIETYKIVFFDGAFSYVTENDDYPTYIYDNEYAICINEFEVIGNIYDNPELLKEV